MSSFVSLVLVSMVSWMLLVVREENQVGSQIDLGQNKHCYSKTIIMCENIEAG